MCDINIRSRMVDLNINQTELAALMGKSKSQVSRYFSGENGIPEEDISDLFKALGYIVLERERYKGLLQDSKELTERKIKDLDD